MMSGKTQTVSKEPITLWELQDKVRKAGINIHGIKSRNMFRVLKQIGMESMIVDANYYNSNQYTSIDGFNNTGTII